MKAVSILLLVLCSVMYVNCAVRASLSWTGNTCNGTLLGGSAIAPAFDCQPTVGAATFTQYQCTGTGALQVRTCTDGACTTGCSAYAAVAACVAGPVTGFSLSNVCYESFAAVPTQTSRAGVVADFYASNATACTTSAQGYRVFGPTGQCIPFPSGYSAGSSWIASCSATNVPTLTASRNNATCGGTPTAVTFASATVCAADNISYFPNNWGVAARCVAALNPTNPPTARPSNSTTATTGSTTTTTSSAAALFVSAFVLLATVFVAAL